MDKITIKIKGVEVTAPPPLTGLFRQAEDYFFKGISQKCLALGDGAKAYKTGIKLADFNLVYLHKNSSNLGKILVKSKKFFDQDKLSFVVIIPQEICSCDVKNTLDIMGYTQTSKSLAMSLKLEELVFNTASIFDDEVIIEVNEQQLDDWITPLREAFESTFEISAHYANAHANALKKKIKLHHLSLYKQGKPIASITLSIQGREARIDDVGTLPTFQGNGFATRLIGYALLEAKKCGAVNCFLEASVAGLSIYKKLGFKRLYKNNIYSYLGSE